MSCKLFNSDTQVDLPEYICQIDCQGFVFILCVGLAKNSFKMNPTSVSCAYVFRVAAQTWLALHIPQELSAMLFSGLMLGLHARHPLCNPGLTMQQTRGTV